MPRTLSRPCRHLLRHLICVEVDRRLDIHAVLRHPWFLQGTAPATGLCVCVCVCVCV